MNKKEEKETLLEKILGYAIAAVIVFFVCKCHFSDNDSKYDKKIAKTEQTTSFVGKYTATDAVGTKFTFILSEDGTAKCIEKYKSIYGVANSYSKNNEFGKYKQTETKTHYGSWKKLSNAVPCDITISDGPIIYFDADNNSEYGFTYQIKNGYLYTNIYDCKASNPNRRLKLTKQ
jgi:hypothetical protein